MSKLKTLVPKPAVASKRRVANPATVAGTPKIRAASAAACGAGGEGGAQSSSSGASSSGGGCTAPMLDCGGKCVDPSLDPDHCGMCNNACPMVASCSNSACACPGSLFLCGDACLDGSMDPANCGACGHNCLGGICVGSMCQPIILAKGQSNPQDVAVNKDGVFWTAKGSGQIMALLNGNMGVLASNQINASWIDVDPTSAYFTTFLAPTGAVKKIPLVGGGNPTTLFGNAFAPNDIAVNSTDVYWADYDGAGKGTLSKVPKNGGILPPDVLLTGPFYIRGIALDANNVYYTNAIAGDLSVSKISLDGSNPQMLLGGLKTPFGIAVDLNNVYWTELNGGTVRSMPIDGSLPPPPPLAEKLLHPNSVAVDATDVYWTDNMANTVMKVPKTGGMPITLATGQGSPQRITLDATAIYWVNPGSGTVMKLAK